MELEELLAKAKEIKSSLDRKLYFTAILTEALKGEGAKPIIVGGTAVEFYTLGGIRRWTSIWFTKKGKS